MKITTIEVAGPGEGPYGVLVHGGAVWTTLVHAGAVLRVGDDHAVERFHLGAPGSAPSVLAAGPDGAVWFTRSGDRALGRIDPMGQISVVPTNAGTPYGLCSTSDGLWFTVMDADSVGHVDAGGAVTQYPIGVAQSFPAMITGRGDTVWFTLNSAGAIGCKRGDDVTIVPLPTEAAGPVGISAGPEVVWFTELLAGTLGTIDDAGHVREFPLPDRASKPHAVAATSDGGCWATLWGSGSVVRVDAVGQLVGEYALGDNSEPHGLALADDGSVWVALETGFLAHLEP